MPFEKIRCTESLAAELGLPAGLLQNKHRNPIGRTVVYDLAGKVVLIPNPLHYSCYPDQDFTLVINGECLSTWEKPQNGEKAHHNEVYVRQETEHFDDATLIAIARQAFASLRGEGAYETPVEIRGRTPPPATVREPEAVIAYLNRFTALAPNVGAEIFWTLSVQNLVPTLVKPAELDALVQCGKETGWNSLTPEARKRFGESLSRLASEHSRSR